MAKLSKEYFLNEDVLFLAKDLLGKKLFSNINGHLTGGIIVETEAYQAPEDKASHAFGNKRTPRTEPFYLEGGIAYVYLCYGIHNLFNIVTNKENIPHAILIRAIEPSEGIEIMLERRRRIKISSDLTAGPGALSVALGINVNHNKEDLTGNTIWLEDNLKVIDESIIKGPRVGVAYAGEWASMPWRFKIKDNHWVSKAK